MTINAIEIAAEGEDSDESDYEEDSDDEEEEDSDDEEEEDSDDEEEEDGDMKMGGGWGAAKPVKKSFVFSFLLLFLSSLTPSLQVPQTSLFFLFFSLALLPPPQAKSPLLFLSLQGHQF